jgi:hypothetical protein
MMLTVELKMQINGLPEEVAICCDQQGLELLVAKLQRLSGKKDHMHLMTPSWAGNDLTEAKQGGDEYELIHHLRLVKT